MSELSNRKRKALIQMALRGTEHEKNIALKLIEKYKISLELESPKDYSFKYKNELEDRLLHQITGMLDYDKDFILFTYKNKRKTFGITCKESSYLEIDLAFSLYKKSLEEEIEITYRGFVQSNMIFPPSDIVPEHKEISEIERKALRRSQQIDKININKQIGEI